MASPPKAKPLSCPVWSRRMGPQAWADRRNPYGEAGVRLSAFTRASSDAGPPRCRSASMRLPAGRNTQRSPLLSGKSPPFDAAALRRVPLGHVPKVRPCRSEGWLYGQARDIALIAKLSSCFSSLQRALSPKALRGRELGREPLRVSAGA